MTRINTLKLSFKSICISLVISLFTSSCVHVNNIPQWEHDSIQLPHKFTFNERSQWETTKDEKGIYRIYYCRNIRPDKMQITVSESKIDRKWEEWLQWGCNDALSKITYLVDNLTGKIIGYYDHHKKLTHFYKQKQSNFLIKEGRNVSSGSGIYAPGRISDLDDVQEPLIWLGLLSKKVDVKTRLCPAKFGLAIHSLRAFSGADLAGMKRGDILVKLGPWDYNHDVLTSYSKLGNAILDRYLAGDQLTFEFIRPHNNGEYKLIKASISIPHLPLRIHKPSKEIIQFGSKFLPEKPNMFKGLLKSLVSSSGKGTANEDLLKRLHKAHSNTDRFLMAPFFVAHRDPFLMDQVAQYCISELASPKSSHRINSQIRSLNNIFLLKKIDKEYQQNHQISSDGEIEYFLDYMEEVLQQSAIYNKQIFSTFTENEYMFVRNQIPNLLQTFMDYRMLDYDPDIIRQRKNVKLFELAEKISQESLILQGLCLSQLTNHEFLNSLKIAMENYFQLNTSSLIRNTKYGEIILSGKGNDYYYKGQNAAVIIDIGGDDYYANNTGSSMGKSIPGAVLIDFSGNDKYENWRSHRQASGLMGVGILIDYDGDDSYIASRNSQGAGFMGLGFLIDKNGNDSYYSIDSSQGIGQFGAGFLLDNKGDNYFDSGHVSQGVGFTAGIGVLYCADEEGNDIYYNKGQLASGYNDDGSFEGWGQGLGVGYRPFTSGGIGILVDQGGKDKYLGGTFSQGGGYFYGLGILNDIGNGNDYYQGTRYNMGFSAHQAAGIFIDDGGDDTYFTSHQVALSIAWDESVSLFLDRSGNDTYTAPNFSLSAAAMNGFTLFIDAQGADQYLGGAVPAKTYGNSYHGGSSCAFFLDLGDDKDVYDNKRKNGEITVENDHAFFVDSLTIDTAIEYLRNNSGKLK